MLTWISRYSRAAAAAYLGFIPDQISDDDPRPAREQFNSNHPGGWTSLPGFTIREDGSIKYPGDPALPWIAETRLRDEIIRVYEFGWVAIIQPDSSYEIARMD